jgi:hypothetical protein
VVVVGKFKQKQRGYKMDENKKNVAVDSQIFFTKEARTAHVAFIATLGAYEHHEDKGVRSAALELASINLIEACGIDPEIAVNLEPDSRNNIVEVLLTGFLDSIKSQRRKDLKIFVDSIKIEPRDDPGDWYKNLI